MNPKFLNLPEEKKMRIINAGMEQFGKFGYKKAVTEDIAAKAGISKGLLFHYFKDKKTFYMYLYDFCEKLLIKKIRFDELKEIDDFFEVLSYGSTKKLELIADYPYLMNFCLKAYFSHKEAISPEMNERIQKIVDEGYHLYFQYVDFSRFKDDVDPQQIYCMMIWMAEGYLLEKQRTGQALKIEEMVSEFEIWKTMFKKMSYKEQYL